jgi:predicted ArsR family transcriptional regulator
VEHNCALHDIAMRHRQACESELEFLRKLLPDTLIEREQHIVHGAPACVYRIRPGGPSRA